MGLLTHYIKDDRGRKVPAVNIFGVGIKQYCHDDFTLKDMKRLRRDVHFRSKSIWICGFAGGGHALVYQAFGWSPWFRSLQPTLRWSLLAGFALVFASTLIILLTKVRSMMDAGLVRKVFLEEKRCASCAYTIADVTPEQDGCRVCRECGAAWKHVPLCPHDVGCLTPSMADDRGRRVRIARLICWDVSKYCGADLTKSGLRNLQRASFLRSWAGILLATWAGVALVLFVLLLGSRWYLEFGIIQRLLLAVVYFLAAGVLVPASILRWSRGLDARLIRSVFLRVQRCPSCRSNIREVEIDADRCVVCTECGAAWRLKEAGA